MKGGDAIDSARTSSIALIVTAWVGWSLANGSSASVTTLVRARMAFAQDIVHKHSNDGEELAVAGVGSVRVTIPNTRHSSSILDGESEPEKDNSERLIAVSGRTGRTWSITVPYSESDEAHDSAVADLKQIAVELGVSASHQDDAATVFRDVESKLVDQEVKIPLLELSFRQEAAAWVIASAGVGLMIMLANLLRRVALDPEAAIEKPWLVLDADARPEKVVALGWVLAILLSPWIAVACPTVVYASRIIADGAVTGILFDLTVIATLCILLTGCVWSCLRVAAAFVVLREMRTKLLATVYEGDGS